jgi:hypothetical protein
MLVVTKLGIVELVAETVPELIFVEIKFGSVAVVENKFEALINPVTNNVELVMSFSILPPVIYKEPPVKPKLTFIVSDVKFVVIKFGSVAVVENKFEALINPVTNNVELVIPFSILPPVIYKEPPVKPKLTFIVSDVKFVVIKFGNVAVVENKFEALIKSSTSKELVVIPIELSVPVLILVSIKFKVVTFTATTLPPT